METAIANHYTAKLFTAPKPVEFFKHESVSKHVVTSDPEITQVLAGHYQPDEIYRIFNREKPPKFANLVSSDLDADRIDYMLRTAHHTGLPYGSVDIGYLLNQLRVDSENHLCVASKAIRTAEHYLLCRFFDYQQVVYHKTVAGLEWILKDLLTELFSRGLIECHADWVLSAIRRGKWASFDEAFVATKIAALGSQSRDKVIKAKVCALNGADPRSC